MEQKWLQLDQALNINKNPSANILRIENTLNLVFSTHWTDVKIDIANQEQKNKKD